MVSYGASGGNDCSVDRVEQRLVSPTSVTISWSTQCPEQKLKYFRFYLTHKEYRACDDKTKKADLLTSKEYNVSAREVIKSKESHHTHTKYSGDNIWGACLLPVYNHGEGCAKAS